MVAETPAAPAAAGAIVAVGDARSSTGKLPTPDLEGVKQLLTQTRAIGIILPPPDIRAIIDKTAQFVAKNGLEFEKKILLSEANNVKFNFLNATDPYHAYYRMRVKNFSEPEEGEKEAAQEGSTAAAAAATAAAAAAAAAAAQAAVPAPAPVTTRPLEKPADEKYTVHVPEGLTALDLDLIKLTAQFVARNGAAFLTGLTQREGNNPAFYFLKPTHSMFGFFTSLADAYSAVLMPDKGLRGQLAQDASDRAVILERCLKRLEWDKARAREAQELEDEIERERLAMQQIDWHDFVVVETIDFYDDEDEELPPPMSLKELVAFNKQQALQGELPEEEAAAMEQDGEQANGGVAAMDEEERALLAQAAGAAAGDEGAAPPPSMPPPTGVTAAPETADEEMEDDMDIGDDDTLDDEGPIKVVKNYKRVTGPRTAMTAAGEVYDPTKFAVSPITGELIAHEDMAEHMRISLLDPRWKEQKEAMLNKIKDTTKADDDEITRNLIGLARTRPDIFGSTEEELAEVVTAAVKEKQTSGQGRAVAWDGQTTGGAHLRAQVQEIADNRKDLGSSSTAAAAGSSLPHAGPSSLGPGGQQQQQRAGGNLPPPPVLAPPVRPPQQQQQPPQQQQQQQRGGPLPPPPMRPPPPMGMGGPGGPPHMHMPPPPMGMGGPPMRPPMPGPPPSMMGGPPMRPPMPMGGPPRGMMPPGPPGAGPAAAAGRPPPQMDREDEAAAKRPRVDFVLTPEDEFLEQHGEGPSRVCVQCPEVPGSDKLVGQMLEVEMASLRDTVGHLKSRLEGVTGVAVNKQKLNREGVGFLRDEMTLAHYNVSPDVVLVLGTKDRGGKKK